MLRIIFKPTFGNICDWECSHCGTNWESIEKTPGKCPSCNFEETLKKMKLKKISFNKVNGFEQN